MTRRLPLVLASLVLGAACSAGSSQPTVTHPGLPMPSYATQVAERNRATIAYAAQLAGRAPHLPGEKALSTPPSDLKTPDARIGVDNLTVRSRYWTVPGSPDSIYRALKRAATPGLRLSGWGRPSSPAEEVAGRGFVYFDPTSPPSYVDDAELYVDMEAGSTGQTIIASFSEVAARPVRLAAETVPVAGSKVMVTRIRVDRPVRTIRSVALGSEQSAAFVRAFNAAPVRAPGTCIGGIGPSYTYRVAIVSGARTWNLGYDGVADCDALSVTSNGQALPELDYSPALLQLIATDYLDGKGFIEGSLGTVGGPDRDSLHAVHTGTVTAISHGRVLARSSVAGQLGNFELEVPPGQYTLTGSSPSYEGGRGVCRGYKSVTVRSNRSASVNVLCEVR